MGNPIREDFDIIIGVDMKQEGEELIFSLVFPETRFTFVEHPSSLTSFLWEAAQAEQNLTDILLTSLREDMLNELYNGNQSQLGIGVNELIGLKIVGNQVERQCVPCLSEQSLKIAEVIMNVYLKSVM